MALNSPNLTGKRYHPATEIVYFDSSEPGKTIKDPYNSSSVPIYQTATFKQESVSQGGEYDYTRSGNPTRSHLENHMAKLMGAARALTTTSGMGALDVIMRLVKTGEEVIAGDDLYGGNFNLLYDFGSFQIFTTSYSCMSDI